MNHAPDIDLVHRLRNGDVAAGGLLYERYKRKIYTFVRAMVRDDAAAEDILQQTFLAMIEKIGTVKDPSMFRSWLYSIARNEAMMLLRRRKIVPMDPLEEADDVVDPSTPLLMTEGIQTSDLIRTALLRLRPLYREAFLLRERDGMSYDEIVAVTGASLTAVKSRLFQARLALNTQLTPFLDEGAL